MKSFIFILLNLLIWIPVNGDDFPVRRIEGTGFTIDLPPEWIPVKSSDMEMLIRSEKNQQARLSILRFEIDKDNRLTAKHHIMDAIQGLYDQLGIDSAGHENIKLSLNQDRATFDVDYAEYDSGDSSKIDVILQGIIVRSKKDIQIFFLLRGYIPENAENSIVADLKTMMASFNITLPVAKTLFPTKSGYGILILFFAITLMAFFYLRNRRVQSSKNPLGRDSEFFWRCPDCQLANHVDHNKCQRCGCERIIPEKTR